MAAIILLRAKSYVSTLLNHGGTEDTEPDTEDIFCVFSVLSVSLWFVRVCGLPGTALRHQAHLRRDLPVIPTERAARERRDPHRESESLPGGDPSTPRLGGASLGMTGHSIGTTLGEQAHLANRRGENSEFRILNSEFRLLPQPLGVLAFVDQLAQDAGGGLAVFR